ncbi:hypothetical protein AVEN_43574-1 [Araneus ventricosus]|uniref:Mutator-like transposase domain-containing protein n=1 Tax=Araneus ventricosus TaxID=182803 RepID=A0A4Y2ELQ6_ARAVE|nr:hypothetical protein AVEN_43574-1 [Araneus ventricosus]
MGRSTKTRSRKRKFCGNQYSSSMSNVNTSVVVSAEQKENKQRLTYNKLTGNRILDIEILMNVFSILFCPVCSKANLFLFEDSVFGLCSNLTLKCNSSNCDFVKAFSTSKKYNKLSEINIRIVYGLRLIGRGFSAAVKLCSTLNLPNLSKMAYRSLEKRILLAVTEVAKKTMGNAAQEVKTLKNSQENVTRCGVSVDGTWQRRGYSSLNGCVSVLSIDTGKILDVEIMSQYCRTCKKLQGVQKHVKLSKHNCSNHKGSSANMESVGAYRIFERSQSSHQLLYTDYYGDGDSKAYETVKEIYDDTTINKLECIGHIQKRVGTRLRKLKNKTPSVRGKGKLTDKFIDKLQNYYGIAIRSNVGNLENMQRTVISAFYHCCSSSRQLMHGQCPEGKESWCRYQ